MFKGVYKGKKAETLKNGILILGESHHDSKENGNFTTDQVINTNYRNNPKNSKYSFFHTIAKTFGVNTDNIDEEFENFWDYVYFGNYIEVLCGVGDSRAKLHLKDNNNRIQYNDELFKFVNDKKNNIDYIFVFSRLVYYNLPEFDINEASEKETIFCEDIIRGKRDWIAKSVYKSNTKHEKVNEILKRDIIVFSMRHPSSRCGYNSYFYQSELESVFKGLLK